MTVQEERVRALAIELVEALLEVARFEAGRSIETPKVVSIEEAAGMLGIRRTALYGLIQRGEVRTHKVGRRRVVSVASIESLLAGRPDER